ncbi:hypothetical protein NGC25_12205 [Enterococcus faecalis]|uniref:hypothetical protein n=1 Tax=Enterococcus faecalis TaxID=1351 RepID=UPI00138660D5|nr:hypothetical protein [Enterococcus faecalis]MEB7428040.1 hypothetical protein [Enterococcus faecalis]
MFNLCGSSANISGNLLPVVNAYAENQEVDASKVTTTETGEMDSESIIQESFLPKQYS